MFPYLRFSEAEVNAAIGRTTSRDVGRVLRGGSHSFFDLLTLLSPPARELLGDMREVAATCRKMHFGKAIRLYAPLYFSNHCVNACKYCDFNHDNPTERRALSLEEIIAETDVIRAAGIDSLLLVAGEDPKSAPMDFLELLVREMKRRFHYLAIELAPMETESYRRLQRAGVDGVTLYQETYNQELYKELHPRGPKRNYQYRLDTHARAAAGGIRNLGLGFLNGLYDWRLEAASLGAHGFWLRRHAWRSMLQFSFPRITPISGGFQPPAPVSEADLEQMMLAFRIIFPEADLTISTRERPAFRDRMAVLCAGNMSAGSRVAPGAYGCTDEHDIGQFTLNDGRSAEEIRASVRRLGLEPVTKYFDRNLNEPAAV